jgi:predicted nucleic acid-binding protein
VPRTDARPVLVVDSTIAVRSSLEGHWGIADRWRPIAPPLLWSEVLSVLRGGAWRREITEEEARSARATFAGFELGRDDPCALADEAWQIAGELGLAKTYDAEFLALARIRDCRLVTADARLRRAADRLGFVVDPVELERLGNERR